MPKALKQSDLDQLICGVPGCEHKNHTTVLYLHSRCHTGCPLIGFFQDAVLELMCPMCMSSVGKIAVNTTAAGLLQQKCHPDSGIWPSYERGSGVILVTCYECGEECDKILVV